MTLLSAVSAVGKTSQLRSKPCQTPESFTHARCVENAEIIFQQRSSGAGYFINWKSWERAVGLEVGGYTERPDWPKLGPSLLIATCLILAIRTAKRPPLSTRALPTQSWTARSTMPSILRAEYCLHFFPKRKHLSAKARGPVSTQRRGCTEVNSLQSADNPKRFGNSSSASSSHSLSRSRFRITACAVVTNAGR